MTCCCTRSRRRSHTAATTATATIAARRRHRYRHQDGDRDGDGDDGGGGSGGGGVFVGVGGMTGRVLGGHILFDVATVVAVDASGGVFLLHFVVGHLDVDIMDEVVIVIVVVIVVVTVAMVGRVELQHSVVATRTGAGIARVAIAITAAITAKVIHVDGLACWNLLLTPHFIRAILRLGTGDLVGGAIVIVIVIAIAIGSGVGSDGGGSGGGMMIGRSAITISL